MEREHHPFSPSKLALYEKCPFAFTVISQLKHKPDAGDAALRGEFIHNCIYQGVYAIDGRVADKEEVSQIDKCLEVMRQFRLNYPDATIFQEEKLEVRYKDEMFGEEVVTSGYPDFMAIDRKSYTGWIIDWKTGANPVNQDDCIQLDAYGVGLAQKYGLNRVFRAIFQCSLMEPEKLMFYECDLGHALDRILTIKTACQVDVPRYKSGSDTCSLCDGRNECPHAIRALDRIQSLGGLMARIDAIKDPKEMADLYESAQIAEKLCKTIKSKATAMAKDNEGKLDSRFCLTSRGMSYWRDEVSVVKKAQQLLPQSSFSRIIKVTANDIRDELIKLHGETKGKEVFDEEFGEYITSVNTEQYLRAINRKGKK